jgi:hypothetical protein
MGGLFMAAAALVPRVRLLAVCDGVRESKTEAGVFHLRGVRQEIMANFFPFVPTRLWLFMLLSSPRAGGYPGYVRVINDRTDKAIFYGKLTPRPTFEAHDEVVATRSPIRCSFPDAGLYTVQVGFFQEQGSDVVKGELPFSIVNGVG